MYVVRILSICDNNTALGTDSQGRFAFIGAGFPYDPNSYWYIDQAFTPDGAPVGVSIRHVNTGWYMTALPGATPGSSMDFRPAGQLDGWSTWTLGNIDREAFAIRSFNNSSLNLNILGGCGHGGLGVWGWGGGQKNEVWRFLPVAGVPVPPRRRYRIDSGCTDFKGNHPPLALGANGSVNAGGDVPGAVWNVELIFKPDGSLQPGVAIVNEGNGQALHYFARNSPVGFSSASSFDAFNLWTFGGGGPYVAVRPVADANQNLNVAGGCRGVVQPVVSWSWSGGQPNEIWAFHALV
jgi:hypothetical protein